jgi:hypothetical protein
MLTLTIAIKENKGDRCQAASYLYNQLNYCTWLYVNRACTYLGSNVNMVQMMVTDDMHEEQEVLQDAIVMLITQVYRLSSTCQDLCCKILAWISWTFFLKRPHRFLPILGKSYDTIPLP